MMYQTYACRSNQPAFLQWLQMLAVQILELSDQVCADPIGCLKANLSEAVLNQVKRTGKADKPLYINCCQACILRHVQTTNMMQLLDELQNPMQQRSQTHLGELQHAPSQHHCGCGNRVSILHIPCSRNPQSWWWPWQQGNTIWPALHSHIICIIVAVAIGYPNFTDPAAASHYHGFGCGKKNSNTWFSLQ